MKLYVQNIAKIESAEVAVDGISVLAGYNATGKSTISKSLSGIIRAYTNIHQRAHNSQIRSIDSIIDSFIEELIPEEGLYMRNNRNLIQAILSKDVSLPSNYKPFPDLFLLYVSDMHEDFPEPSAETEELYQDFLGQMQRALSRPLEEHIQFLVESNIREVFDRQVNTLGQT